MSPSIRRAWIEIDKSEYKSWTEASPSIRRAWIEILRYKYYAVINYKSPSIRRAWIEIKN